MQYQNNQGAFSRQQGVATVLVILLLGIGMLAASVGLMHAQRNVQERQVAVHAQTHAQSAVWAAADTLRQFLATLDATQIAAIAPNTNVTIDNGTQATLAAVITEVIPPDTATTPPETDFRVTARVRAIDTAARASSTLEVVYGVSPTTSAADVELQSGVTFGDDLNITGGIDFNAPEGETFDMLVDGNISVNNVSVSGIGRLGATGDVTLGSAVQADELFANGDVTITGGAQPDVIYAVGNVTMSGGSSGKQIFANGTVNFASGSAYASVSTDSRSDIIVNTWQDHGELTAGGKIQIHGGTTAGAWAVENVEVSGGGVNVAEIYTQAEILCDETSVTFPIMHAGGTIDDDCTGGEKQANMLPPPAIDVMDELEPISVTPPEVDVWALKNKANYVFEIDGEGRKKVTVRSVNSLSDGEYYLGTYNSTGGREYLCELTNNEGRCTIPASVDDAKTICYGFSTQNSCFSYSEANQEWSVNGTTLAPGAMWFRGSLEVSNGEYYNTFMATGNIRTTGMHRTHAVNFSGADTICNNAQAIPDFNGLYPTNFCAVSAGVANLIPNSLGNIALMAGGKNPANDPPFFEGGQVTLGANTIIYGNILAGDVLGTGGQSTVYGYISASGLADGEVNVISARTTIDLSDLPDGFNPALVPDVSGSTGGGTGSSSVLWSRYF